jgi:hypothetical protein
MRVKIAVEFEAELDVNDPKDITEDMIDELAINIKNAVENNAKGFVCTDEFIFMARDENERDYDINGLFGNN